MPRKSILYLIIGMLTITISLISLIQFSELPNTYKNGFERQWLPYKINLLYQVSYKAPLDKICGATANHIFFNVPNPKWLVMMDLSLSHQDTIFYGLPEN